MRPARKNTAGDLRGDLTDRIESATAALRDSLQVGPETRGEDRTKAQDWRDLLGSGQGIPADVFDIGFDFISDMAGSFFQSSNAIFASAQTGTVTTHDAVASVEPVALAPKPNGHDACCGCADCCEADADAAGTSVFNSETSDADPPFFSPQQVADQLVTGYWSAVNGSAERSFAVTTGGTLNVDISGLQPTGQSLARQALDAWSAVTGITFAEVEALPDPSVWTDEGADAAGLTTTAYSISVGEGFRGTMSTGADRDAVAVDLTAGGTYTIALRGDDRNGNPTFDPYLRVYDAAGSLVAENDDAESFDSRLSFTASTSGTYYLQAGSYADFYGGDYTLQISDDAAEVHILFSDQASGAYAQSQTFGTTILSSFVNVNWNWTGGENRIDGYHYQTYLHEIGHALGLGHAGNYNGGAIFGQDNHYANDSWAMSLMSYFQQTENTFTQASFAYAITPMMADLIAIQDLYGIPDFAAGDTIYGRGGDTGTYLDQALDFQSPTAWTVFDTGGTDHFDFSGFAEDQNLDLRDGAWSDLGGLVGNVAITQGSVIENGTTGSGNDILTGNAANNVMRAGAGHDAMFGGDGADTLDGDSGRDLLEGDLGADHLSGGDDGDLLIGEDVTLSDLQMIYPTWTPPADAQSRIDAGEVYLLWDDILSDVFAVA